MSAVLLVEDDQLLGRTISAYLEKAGLTVYWAKKGEDTFEALAAQPVQLILLDIILPDIDGFQVLERLKGNEKYNHIPVVMLTNLSESGQMDKASKMGAVDYIVKSNIEMSELVEVVKTKYLR